MDDKLYKQLKSRWKLLTEGLVKLPTNEIRAWVESHFDEFVTKINETLTKGYNTDIDDYITFVNPYTQEKMEVAVTIQKSVLNIGSDETILFYDPICFPFLDVE